MNAKATVGWLVKCSLSAVLVTFAAGLAAARFGTGLQLPATTTRDGTLVTLNRYVREPAPDVIIVGSSLSFRLKEEYFQTPRLRNLALAGGSPVTGLELVASRPHPPKLLLVEANVLSRPTDTALVQKYARDDANEPLLARPVRVAVAAYEDWNHAPITHAQVAAPLAQVLKQPPSTFDNHVYVQRALEESNTEDPTQAARINVERMRALITALELRGTHVLLFELPLSDALEHARSATVTRAIVHAAFPDPARWLTIDVPRDQLRWADGMHLDERSALIVAEKIDGAIGPMLGTP
jgi:hypothetical protein